MAAKRQTMLAGQDRRAGLVNYFIYGGLYVVILWAGRSGRTPRQDATAHQAVPVKWIASVNPHLHSLFFAAGVTRAILSALRCHLDGLICHMTYNGANTRPATDSSTGPLDVSEPCWAMTPAAVCRSEAILARIGLRRCTFGAILHLSRDMLRSVLQAIMHHHQRPERVHSAPQAVF